MKYKNTLTKGSVRYIIFKEDCTWYGVALEFNLVEEGDNPTEVMSSLFQAIQGYVETAQKYKTRLMPLNQKPDKEYQELWEKLEWEKLNKKRVNATIEAKKVFTFGYSPFMSPALI
jgi:hypothetical protein